MEQPKRIPKKEPHPDITQSPSMKKAKRCAVTLRNEGKDTIFSDTQGSYTGMGLDGEPPVQDADDL